jgi:hypothetical protein
MSYAEQKEIARRAGNYLVVDLDVGDLDDDLLELVVVPSIGSSFHHGKSGVVELVVVNVKEDQLGPEVSLLGGTEDLRDVCKAREEISA